MINNLATGRLSRVMNWRMYETEEVKEKTVIPMKMTEEILQNIMKMIIIKRM